ncbi:MAG: hypothetical protein QM820_27955 [Minicystis sp.]
MTTSSIEPVPRSLRVHIAFAVTAWALLALAVAASGALRGAPPPLVPALIFGVTGAAVIAYLRSPRVRAFVARMDARPAIAYHVVRIAFGLAFLRLGATDELPDAFVRIAGPGDVVAGGLAIAAVVAASDLSSRARRAVVLGWNLIALADILAVIVTAQRLILFAHEPRMLGMMSRFPFATLPTFVVPMVLLTHLAVFVRLRAAARGERG